jgi:hypothetical protein
VCSTVVESFVGFATVTNGKNATNVATIKWSGFFEITISDFI